MDEFILLAGRANPKLAKDIGKILKHEVYEPISVFSDGEIRVQISPNMRRRHVFIIQPTSPHVNDHLMELIFMIDAAKRSSASEITAIIPYFGYARQDRKEMSRVPISSSVVANMIANVGANRIVTIDLHSEQQQGFVRIPWDNLYVSYPIIPMIKAKKLKNIVVASPDKGGVVRATGYAKLLEASGIVIVYKERDINVNDVSESQTLIGEVEGKDILLVDDMISTGGTIINAANYIAKRGAKSIRVAVAHGLFSADALEKISQSSIEELIVTDTIALREDVLNNPKITVASVAHLIAEAIKRIQTGDSISSLILKK